MRADKRKARSARKLAEKKSVLTLMNTQQAARNFAKSVKKFLGLGNEWAERQALLAKMTNWQRHQFNRATTENEGPLPIERVRQIAKLERPSHVAA